FVRWLLRPIASEKRIQSALQSIRATCCKPCLLCILQKGLERSALSTPNKAPFIYETKQAEIRRPKRSISGLDLARTERSPSRSTGRGHLRNFWMQRRWNASEATTLRFENSWFGPEWRSGRGVSNFNKRRKVTFSTRSERSLSQQPLRRR